MTKLEPIPARTRRVIEGEIRSYHWKLRRLIELEPEVDKEFEAAARRGLPWPDADHPRTSGTATMVSDPTPRAVQHVMRSGPYREREILRRKIEAIEAAYRRMDPEQATVLEGYYWGWREARERMAMSERTLRYRRAEIVRMVLDEMQARGLYLEAEEDAG